MVGSARLATSTGEEAASRAAVASKVTDVNLISKEGRGGLDDGVGC